MRRDCVFAPLIVHRHAQLMLMSTPFTETWLPPSIGPLEGDNHVIFGSLFTRNEVEEAWQTTYDCSSKTVIWIFCSVERAGAMQVTFEEE
jgi:hypothetical protein